MLIFKRRSRTIDVKAIFAITCCVNESTWMGHPSRFAFIQNVSCSLVRGPFWRLWRQEWEITIKVEARTGDDVFFCAMMPLAPYESIDFSAIDFGQLVSNHEPS